MSEERRIVCWVQTVIGCTSWEAPKTLRRCSSEIVDNIKKEKQTYYNKKEEEKEETTKEQEAN